MPFNIKPHTPHIYYSVSLNIETLNDSINDLSRVMSSLAIKYYNERFGDNKSAAFIHLVREIGEIAFAIENNKVGIAQTKISEAIAILYYISDKYGIDIEDNIKSLYAKKINSLSTKTKERY